MSKFQTPRGTYDVLPDHAAERDRLEATAKKIFERAGYGRIETPTFEATELFARGVGEATDVVQKEMFTFGDEEESFTLRPEGTAPTVRAYAEHGMHKLPQPVKLWYLSSFFRRETPQAGRFRQFWQIGAEAIGSPDPAVDAEVIVLLAELLEAIGARDTKLVIATLGQPDARAAYREELKAYLRANEDQLSEEVVGRIDLNPLRAFDAKHEPTQRVMAKAPRLIDRLPQDDLDHFAEVQDLLRAADLSYDGRHDARPRARLLHAHAVRVPVRRAGSRAEHARRRRPLRRSRRGARRRGHARRRVGGRGGADAHGVHPAAARRGARGPVRRVRRPSTRSRPSSWRATPAGPGTRQDSNSRGAA